MKMYLRNNNNDELILFMLGWGMDERPFKPLKSNFDVLFVYDYSDLNFEFDFSKYKKITLMAFSCGVFMTSVLKEKLPSCDLKIAINGTLELFDEDLGVTEKNYKILENISPKNYLSFRKNFLTTSEKELNLFNHNQPFRNFESAALELKMLKEYYSKYRGTQYKFDMAIVAEQDKMLLTKNQINYWESHSTKYKISKGGHFNFYNFEDLEQILNFATQPI